jgi:thiopurine S-methyltransferase
MERDFWHERWRNNQIGFHEAAPNALLVSHFSSLDVPTGGRVFVPLCGKSNDMLWLRAQGYRVVGAELSRLAVERFFADNRLAPTMTSAGPLETYESDGITLFAGDLFALDHEILGPVDAVYDRAALVALPASMRERYASHLAALTGHAPQLLVTFEYDQSLSAGPPFSVEKAEVRKHYDALYRLTVAETRRVEGGLKGRHPAQESAWLLRQR